MRLSDGMAKKRTRDLLNTIVCTVMCDIAVHRIVFNRSLVLFLAIPSDNRISEKLLSNGPPPSPCVAMRLVVSI